MRPQRKRQTIVARECLARDADLGFIVEEIPPKGRGVRTTIRRSRGDFLMIYPGKLITEAEGEKREEKDPSVFRYFFHHKREGWCLGLSIQTLTTLIEDAMRHYFSKKKWAWSLNITDIHKSPTPAKRPNHDEKDTDSDSDSEISNCDSDSDSCAESNELPDDRPHSVLVQPTIDELPDDRPHGALVQPTIDELPDDRPHMPHGALVQPTIDELSYVLAQSTIDELSYVLAQSTIDKLPDDCPHDAEPPETNDNPTEDRDCFARQECTEQLIEDSVDEDTCSDISTVWPELSCQNPSGFVLCPSTGEFVMATGHEQIYSKEESMDGFPELAETHLESLPYISTKQSAQVRKVYRRNGHRLYDKALACYFCEKVLHHRIQNST
ncbi:hypothetical protein ScPMuIL_014901 [Solemya velum]